MCTVRSLRFLEIGCELDSNHTGRRKILLLGPLGLSIAMLGFGISKNFVALVIFRAFQGIFNGNIGELVIRESFSTENRQSFSQESRRQLWLRFVKHASVKPL